MNIVAIISLFLGIFLLLVTQQAEVGTIKALFQPTAAAIVFGGTFCATFLNFPAKTIIESFKSAFNIFYDKHKIDFSVIKEITKLSQFSRKDGILSLQKHLNTISNGKIAQGVKQVRDNIFNCEVENMTELYGAIWTSKGLIYVAKNER